MDEEIRRYAEEHFVLGVNDVNLEARENLAAFSMSGASAELGRFVDAILFAGARLRARFSMSTPPVTFYAWYDEQAGQLRLSVVSAGVDELPFGGKYYIVHELDPVTERIRADASPGFVPWNELEEVNGEDSEEDMIVPPFPVFVMPIV